MSSKFWRYTAAIAALLVLVAPKANAGYDFWSYIATPLIAAAELGPNEGEITISGQFCDSPSVYQGLPDGSFAQLEITDNTSSHIVAVLSESKPATYKFGVQCWLGLAAIDVTVPASVNPTL